MLSCFRIRPVGLLRLGQKYLLLASTSQPTSPTEDEPPYRDGLDEETSALIMQESRSPNPPTRQSRSPFQPAAQPRSDPTRAKRERAAMTQYTGLPVRVRPKRNEEDAPRYHPTKEPYEGGYVSVDESPYRLREIMHVREIWRASMMDPGRTFDNLMEHMRPLSLWQSLHAYLIGGKALQTIQSEKALRLKYENEIRDIRDAVVSGEFMWRGKAGIFVQGEMRRGMEPRMYRSDVKDMEEVIESHKRGDREKEIDFEKKAVLESYFQDRLVSEVLRVILEPIFEVNFADHSHGFRPGRTQHTALKQIRRDFADANWIVRSDLRGVFELILANRRKFSTHLRRRMETRVKDKAILDLLFSGIDSRTVMSDYEVNPPEEGYSPLNVKSGIMPLLCNIYFDPVDQWIVRKSKEINRGKYRRINPERAALILRGVEEKVADTILPKDPNDPVYRRLCYCRFADDFVFGLSGPRDLAEELKEEFWSFASEQLLFPLPKNEVVHARTKTRFLGHLLRQRVIMPRKAMLVVRRTKRGRVSTEMDAEEVRVGQTTYQIPGPKVDAEEAASFSDYLESRKRDHEDGPREIMSIDGEVDKIVRLLARAGYCLRNGDPQPNFRHLHFSQSETNQVMRRMLLSICDMYRTARNRQRIVHYCSYIVRHSIAKLYAAKFKLRSRAKVFRRGGPYLGERIRYGKGYVGKIDPDTGTEVEFAELPYARLSDIPKPDLLPLPVNWKPEIMHVLDEQLLGDIPRF